MNTEKDNWVFHSYSFVSFVALFFSFAAAPTTAPVSSELAVAAGGPAVGKREAKLEPYALIRGNCPVGVAVSRGGRIFLSFPGWDGPSGFSVGEVAADR